MKIRGGFRRPKNARMYIILWVSTYLRRSFENHLIAEVGVLFVKPTLPEKQMHVTA